ncbi:MAG: ABC transporter permease subunit, partial [Pseudomonadota bacterium]
LLIQIALIAFLVLVIGSAIRSAQVNLTALGITSGFDFLERATGWSYSFSLIERSIDDRYARTLIIGFLNTLFVGLTSIVFATLLGFIIGAARDSQNPGLQFAAGCYVQFFRNIPLILQVVFLYSILIHLPGPRQSISMLDLVFISNRGMMIPTMNIGLDVVLGLALASVALAFGVTRLAKNFLSGLGIWLCGTVLLIAAAAALFAPSDAALFSIPQLKGLRFVGGLTLTVELVAMIIGIVLYGSSYIAEVVRGGLKEVPKGLIEAGGSLGLKRFTVWFLIKMPMALRAIIPPLGNQWIFIMKATTVGVAIGFSDLFYIVSTSITQSGQTLELIFILMASFLLVNFIIAQLVNLLNARLALKGH